MSNQFYCFLDKDSSIPNYEIPFATVVREDIDDVTQKSIMFFSCPCLRQDLLQLRFNHKIIT